jgi:ribonuclease H / adenosylcobalamin/alpha-ribazole phosphatase
MTTVLFVRHVEHALQHEQLLGRTHDAPFTDCAYWQLTRLTKSLRHEAVAAVHSSPRRRAWETAEAIAGPHRLMVELRAELDELDYGDWSGCCFGKLEDDPQWHRWNTQRGEACPPQGESMRALQDRMLHYMAELAEAYPRQMLVCVTHAEPIRALILHACGMELDEFARIEISPGSVTRMRLVSGTGRPQFVVEARPA